MNKSAHAPQPAKIHGMFSSIAGRYDRANSVLSFGIHHLWRRKAVRWSGAKAGDRVLDVATGTGDLALAFASKVGPNGHVVGTDFCEPMLVHAREKAAKRGVSIPFSVADAMKLPFEDDSFDIASIAFGIRNVAKAGKALSELGRVVRPGGHVIVLEFGSSGVPVWGGLFDFYQKRVLPSVGGWVTGQKGAYEYLQKSSQAFPCGEAFLDLMRKTGRFSSAECRSLSGGIAYLYRATV